MHSVEGSGGNVEEDEGHVYGADLNHEIRFEDESTRGLNPRLSEVRGWSAVLMIRPMHRDVHIMILIRCSPDVMHVSGLHWGGRREASMTRNRRSRPGSDSWLNRDDTLFVLRWENRTISTSVRIALGWGIPAPRLRGQRPLILGRPVPALPDPLLMPPATRGQWWSKAEDQQLMEGTLAPSRVERKRSRSAGAGCGRRSRSSP
jgi:hypothetical protein